MTFETDRQNSPNETKKNVTEQTDEVSESLDELEALAKILECQKLLAHVQYAKAVYDYEKIKNLKLLVSDRPSQF